MPAYDIRIKCFGPVDSVYALDQTIKIKIIIKKVSANLLS